MRTRSIKSQQGFTLVEVMAVLVILGVISSVAVHRSGQLTTAASGTALESAVRELNVREFLVWSNSKLADDTWMGDNTVWAGMDTDLGSGYHWETGPTPAGGTLSFDGQSTHLTRIPSTAASAAQWH